MGLVRFLGLASSDNDQKWLSLLHMWQGTKRLHR